MNRVSVGFKVKRGGSSSRLTFLGRSARGISLRKNIKASFVLRFQSRQYLGIQALSPSLSPSLSWSLSWSRPWPVFAGFHPFFAPVSSNKIEGILPARPFFIQSLHKIQSPSSIWRQSAAPVLAELLASEMKRVYGRRFPPSACTN